MSLFRTFLILAFTLGVIACNKSQPSGVPESTSSSAVRVPDPAPVSKPSAPQAEEAPVKELKVPPPLDDDIPPFAKTGFPDCDNYVEEYRQCLNSRLGGEERKAAAHELVASVNSITASISRGVEPSRTVSVCKKSRRVAISKLERYGCIIQTP